VLDEFPKIMNNYHEAFLGGGSVLLGLLVRINEGSVEVRGRVYACDANEALVHVYKNVQLEPERLYAELQKLITEFKVASECDGALNRNPVDEKEASLNGENYYYWIRKKYNEESDKRSVVATAKFVFLNKTCFRGVFRVGPNGFNVPYGHYKNPEIINKAHLHEVSRAIQSVVFECCDFKESMDRMERGDFAYLDPPYVGTFTGYTRDGFNRHNDLFQSIHKLTKEGVVVLLSNSDTSLVRDSFGACDYVVIPILCKRAIHSKKPDSKAKEVFIKNYQ
jgi:DNA adenine methylase